MSGILARLRALACDAIHEAFGKGDGTAGAEHVLRAVLAGDPVLRDALALELLDGAVRDAIQWAEVRHGVAAAENFDKQVQQLRVHSYWLNVRLSTGQNLPTAKRPEVTAEAALEFGSAREHLARAKFFKAIAAALPDDETPVGVALTEHQLAQMQRRAKQFGIDRQHEPEVQTV